jgi:citrate synthase
MLLDGDQKIARPRQVFLGERDREFVPMHLRKGGE